MRLANDGICWLEGLFDKPIKQLIDRVVSTDPDRFHMGTAREFFRAMHGHIDDSDEFVTISRAEATRQIDGIIAAEGFDGFVRQMAEAIMSAFPTAKVKKSPEESQKK